MKKASRLGLGAAVALHRARSDRASGVAFGFIVKTAAANQAPCRLGASSERATLGYTVAVPVQSIRFARADVHERLRDAASRKGTSASALAERLIDEGLRSESHPLVMFRDGPTGRRAVLLNGPDVWEVVGAVIGSDVPVEERESRAAELLGLSAAQVRAAMDYYAEFTAEIDERIGLNRREADRQATLWERRQQLLAN